MIASLTQQVLAHTRTLQSWDPARVLREVLAGQRTGAFRNLVFPLELEDSIRRASSAPSTALAFQALASDLQLRWHAREEDWARIPAHGPTIVVANHPHGLADGVLLAAALSGIRGDVKILANSLLPSPGAFQQGIIPVNPFGGDEAVRENLRGLRRCLEWLENGGMLVVFPAGEVSALAFPQGKIVEPSWNSTIARLIRMSNATTVPLNIRGTNSAAFHAAGLVHPGLRTLLLAHELLRKRGATISLEVGRPLPASDVISGRTNLESAEYLRWRTGFLGHRATGQPVGARRSLSAIAERGDPAAWSAEIDALPPHQQLIGHGEFRVLVASAGQIPELLHEIGRLREFSFRQAGEGTGGSLDLDEFDHSYQHLILWNTQRREIVGAYRFAATDAGAQKFYTSTLFHFQPGFFERINPGLELGRSFIRPEYQKSFSALHLLWKGIGQYLTLHPQYRYLFGPVSISNLYCPSSRQQLAAYLERYCGDASIASLVKPRHSYREHLPVDMPQLNADELSSAIAELDHAGMPVLLRHYLNLGGKAVGLSIDPKFSRVLDALLIVDLNGAKPRLLERYLGKRVPKDAVTENSRDLHGPVRLTM